MSEERAQLEDLVLDTPDRLVWGFTGYMGVKKDNSII